jgi:hypothetical protein
MIIQHKTMMILIGWASRPVKPNLTISLEQLDAQVRQQMQLQY